MKIKPAGVLKVPTQELVPMDLFVGIETLALINKALDIILLQLRGYLCV